MVGKWKVDGITKKSDQLDVNELGCNLRSIWGGLTRRALL